MNKGFTLVELLISISIFTVITTVAVYNHAQFNGSVLLTNLAYEIGLSVRQAQFYGISVRQNSAASFDSGYGVHFDLNTPTSYILFEDKIGGSAHARDGSDIDLQNFSIAKGNKLSRICINSVCDATIADVTFIRPNPDAYITRGNTTVIPGKIEVCISSPQGSKRKVTVESTGQISVGTSTSICL